MFDWSHPAVILVLALGSAATATAQTVSPLPMDPRAPLAMQFEKAPVPDATMFAGGIAFADMDGDGREDLLVGASLSSSVTAYGFRYYLSRGDGTFADVSFSRTIGAPLGITNFVVVDVDGDGDRDVVGTVMLLRNQNGTLVREWLPSTTSSIECVAAADVDGDADIDLFFGVGFSGGPSQQDRLMINQGNGTFVFAPTTALPLDADTTLDARFLDADGDGDQDLVTGIERLGTTGGGARLYRNNGTGTFTDASTAFPAPSDSVLAVVTGDFDGDGDADVVLGTGADPFGVEQPDRFLRNGGGGVFTLDATALPPVLATTNDVAAADLDGDSDLDLLLAEGGLSDREQRIYRNDGTSFTDVSANWLPPARIRGAFWAAGHLDGDGFRDAALVTGGTPGEPGRVRLFASRGGSTFLDLNPRRLPRLVASSRDVRFADVDGDGDVDVFVSQGAASSAAWPQVLLRNDGHAQFTDVSATDLPAVQHAVVDAQFVDPDADGDLDLLLATEVGVVQWRNDGTGRFVLPPAGTMPPFLRRPVTLSPGDVDNDGDVDVFAGSGALSNQDELLRNDGTGRFTRDTTALPTHSNTGVRSSVMIDYDSDGDRDLVIAFGTTPSGFLTAYQNNGAGQFTLASGVFTSPPPTSRLVPFDADADGDMDLIAEGPSSTVVLRDQGAAFVAAPLQGLAALVQSGRQVTLFDYEGDGDLDIGLSIGGTMSLVRNDGGSQFHLAAVPLAATDFLSRVAGADLNGDRAADFVMFPSSRELEIALGRRVQLHAPWLARVGLPYHLHLHHVQGDMGRLHTGLFLLNTRRLTPPLPIPPFGALAVDPVGATIGMGFALTREDSTDPLDLQFAFTLPNAPILLGATVHSQALALTELQGLLSNHLAERVH